MEARLRQKPEYKQFRQAVIARDNGLCKRCGSDGQGSVNAPYRHLLAVCHIYPWSDYPQGFMNIDNAVLLCGVCHEETDNGIDRIEYLLELIGSNLKLSPMSYEDRVRIESEFREYLDEASHNRHSESHKGKQRTPRI